jgi:hypothetical protein
LLAQVYTAAPPFSGLLTHRMLWFFAPFDDLIRLANQSICRLSMHKIQLSNFNDFFRNARDFRLFPLKTLFGLIRKFSSFSSGSDKPACDSIDILLHCINFDRKEQSLNSCEFPSAEAASQQSRHSPRRALIGIGSTFH